MADFRRGIGSAKSGPFEAGLLPDAEKERLCRSLLAEFGVTSVKVNHESGEMIHSCCLPTGGHKNGDANASASLNFKKLTYNCLGCQSSGGLLWFIALCRGEDDVDGARSWLADQTGTGPDEQSLASLLEFFDAVYGTKEHQRPAPIPTMSPAVLKPWMWLHPYLLDSREEGGRGVPEKTAIDFQVGYAAEYRMKIKVGGDERHIVSPRIVIPHFWKGSLVGWQTRRLVQDGSPKYQSSPDFPKDTTLYNYDPKRRTAVIVESPMSVLARYHHVPSIEATFGAKMTDRQLSLISMHPKVILWLDPDTAGWKATKRAGDYLEAYSEVWVVDSPWNADAADLSDEEADRLLADHLVPYSLWKPPRSLSCWLCKGPAHEGACEEALVS